MTTTKEEIEEIKAKFLQEFWENFENPYSLEEATKLATEKWVDFKISTPTFYPEGEFGLKILKPAFRKNPNSTDCTEYVHVCHSFFPNAQGLVVLEFFDKLKNFVPNGTWVIGFDYFKHLPFQKRLGGGHLVPYLEKDWSGNYSYGFFPYGMVVDHDERIMVFTQPK